MSVRARSRGFTVFEMMVVAAIVAIVTAIAVPGVRELRVTSRVATMADDISTSMALAKSEAISRRRVVYVVFTEVSSVTTGWSVRYDNASTGTILRSYTVASPSVVTRNPANRKTFYFNPTGQFFQEDATPASALSMTFTVCDSDSKKEVGRNITVSPVGRILSLRHASATVCAS